MNWQLWFVRLSGWPVFLSIVGLVLVFMLVASVVLTWLGNRSVVRAMVLTGTTITILAVVVLFALAWLTKQP